MTIDVRRVDPPELGRCRGRHCGADIEWVITTTGRRMPVTAPIRPLEGAAAGWTRIDMDQSHFVTCPDAAHFKHG